MVNSKTNQEGGKVAACEHDDVCEVVSCQTCLSEIPSSVAQSVEGPDYVYHFCGLNCLDEWRKKAGDDLEKPEARAK